MSQAELGRLCGIPQSTIGRIESGQVNPNLATLEKLAEALSLEFAIKESDVRPDYLKRWDGLHAICYWKDEPVSEFYVSGSVVRVKRFVQHPVKQIFNQEKMDIVALSEILKRRCWEENRDGLAQILQKLGIAHYDPLSIVKKTHGVSYNDFLWFQFDGEQLFWADVATRNRYV